MSYILVQIRSVNFILKTPFSCPAYGVHLIGQLAAIKTLLGEQEAPVAPFALNSDALVTVPYRGVGQGTLDSAIQTYFSDWQEVFLTNAIDLPKPFLEGRAYRQWCFHAWVGDALLRAVNVKPRVVGDAVE